MGCSPWRTGCDISWRGERGIVLPTTNKNGRIICLICNLMSKSVVSTLSVRICSHPKEIPKIKAYFILILHHSVTQSDKAVIISFFACCHWKNKKVLVSCGSFHTRKGKLCPRSGMCLLEMYSSKLPKILQPWKETRKCNPDYVP